MRAISLAERCALDAVRKSSKARSESASAVNSVLGEYQHECRGKGGVDVREEGEGDAREGGERVCGAGGGQVGQMPINVKVQKAGARVSSQGKEVHDVPKNDDSISTKTCKMYSPKERI